ncbi:aldehyde dehydrogenase family protein [Microbacterium sp. cx-55]|uniref:aldehyde dehydrogenase family protein n=1 Tax=Microbacterium sp. cx-55 TaxID=2875948 RepID=UPI001CBC2CEB|nr:aldehyde dehydrogenase family protein [Microbacterium sp. cx-55]MBZ4487401.1 aldehyde dehydrogenase family protein [Microbacterium sp. cx-55]UGB35421.1 aldehyde dehydrogenase family protein [Microbacterium sp. cx-55]
MTSISPAPSELSDAETAALDLAIDELATGADAWSTLRLDQRASLLDQVRDAVGAVAEEWATIAAASKGLDARHPLRGEEWLSGPYAVLSALDGYLRTLRTLARGASPLDGVRIDAAPDDRIRAHVFPASAIDALLLSGHTGEVWFRPGVDAGSAARAAGLGQLDPGAPAGVGLVLGAGNITAIPVLDVLYELLAENRVGLLKVNPTQDALVPVFERALAPLIDAGFVRIVRGGGPVGAYLTRHPSFAHVHITGSATTFDAIVWGTGPDAVARRASGEPLLTTPITAELGGVSPIIVVPGPWTDADLRFQAEHIATMRLHNSGHNCIAGQVVLLSRDWPQRDAFLRALETAYAAAPARPVWYPHAAERLTAAGATYPGAQQAGGGRLLVEVAAGDDPHPIETTEYFAPVLGVVELGGHGGDFLRAAIAHANERLTGTLGANVLIDPATERDLGDDLDRAIADLRYGGIAINAWTGVVFATPILSWGAFPGSTLDDVGSGLGIVHNTLLLAGVERSVLRGPFRPFPRSLGRGRFSVLPTPPWFVTSRTSTAVSEGLTRYLIGRSPLRLIATLIRAMGA